MKVKVRYGVFETNSSSVHSLTVCSKEDFEKFKKGEVYYDECAEAFRTEEQLAKDYHQDFTSSKFKDWLNEQVEEGEIFENYEKWQRSKSKYYETFREYCNIAGVDLVSFGYYGYDG